MEKFLNTLTPFSFYFSWKMSLAFSFPLATLKTISSIKLERKLSFDKLVMPQIFEQIVFHLIQGDIWKTADHPDQKKYSDQKIYFVIVEDYIYLVPFVAEDVDWSVIPA